MKPILFNTKMVQAILKGNKTVTRRKIDWDIINNCDIDTDGTLLNYQNNYGDFINPVDLCRYKVGDIIWVRETWSFISCDECKRSESHTDFNSKGCGISDDKKDCYKDDCGCFIYRTNYGTTEDDTFPPSMHKWKPSIHMSKKAARIFLKVTDVRVERLQDITCLEAKKEGVLADEKIREDGRFLTEKGNFIDVWNSTTKDHVNYGWDSDCFVWVIEFERVEDKNENCIY